MFTNNPAPRWWIFFHGFEKWLTEKHKPQMWNDNNALIFFSAGKLTNCHSQQISIIYRTNILAQQLGNSKKWQRRRNAANSLTAVEVPLSKALSLLLLLRAVKLVVASECSWLAVYTFTGFYCNAVILRLFLFHWIGIILLPWNLEHSCHPPDTF